MRSIPQTVRVPSEIKEITKKRSKEAGYESVSEYALGLIRYDLMTRKPHITTQPIAKMSRAEQDKVDAEIVKMYENGESIAGSWFEARVRAAVEACGIPMPEQPKLVAELMKRITGEK